MNTRIRIGAVALALVGLMSVPAISWGQGQRRRWNGQDVNAVLGGVASIIGAVTGANQGGGPPNQGTIVIPNQGNILWPNQGGILWPNQGGTVFPNQGGMVWPNQGNTGQIATQVTPPIQVNPHSAGAENFEGFGLHGSRRRPTAPRRTSVFRYR